VALTRGTGIWAPGVGGRSPLRDRNRSGRDGTGFGVRSPSRGSRWDSEIGNAPHPVTLRRAPSSLRSLAKLFREDLPAQSEAFIADGRRLVLFARRRRDEGLDLDPCFSAERAGKVLACGDRFQLRIRRRSTRRGDAHGGQDAGVADIHAGSSNELANLSLLAPAERASSLGGGFLRSPSSPPANAAVLDDLVDALVADAESCGNLAHRCAGQVKPSDCSPVFLFGPLELVLKFRDAASRSRGVRQQVLIDGHLSMLDRQMTMAGSTWGAGLERLPVYGR
jgi:hypothetical protein